MMAQILRSLNNAIDREIKAERAKLILGERWLLHPANHVKRAVPQNPAILALVKRHA